MVFSRHSIKSYIPQSQKNDNHELEVIDCLKFREYINLIGAQINDLELNAIERDFQTLIFGKAVICVNEITEILSIGMNEEENQKYIFEAPLIFRNMSPKEMRVLARLISKNISSIKSFFQNSYQIKITVKGEPRDPINGIKPEDFY